MSKIVERKKGTNKIIDELSYKLESAEQIEIQILNLNHV